MRINRQFDKDDCIAEELIPNSVEWLKEKGGDNILIQYINGGESMRAIDRFAEDVQLVHSHYNGKSLFVMTEDGNRFCYHQDNYGNFKTLKDLKQQNTLLQSALLQTQLKR